MINVHKKRSVVLGGRLMGFCLLLLLIIQSPIVFGQTRVQISGTVTGEEGDLLSGVSIKTSDGSSTAATDDDGTFAIQVPANSVLVFSYLGYTTQEIAVGQSNQQVDVVLQIEQSALDEVVVVGYGTQRREAVTGSVASIGGDDLRDVPSANISQALQGRLPGVQMTQTSTRPGEGMQIRIRGSRSLTASNDPLLVLDGIPFAGDLQDIDPNSIKSIDVLKDASATAIYGSRGANGVILVTTERGVKGQDARISYSAFDGVKDVFSKFPMMNGPQFARLRAEAIRTSEELGVGAQYPNSADETEGEAAGVDTDWQDLLYETGRTMSHDLRISKGSERGNYSVGMGYFKDKGVLPTNEYSRISLRAAVDQEVGKYLRFGLTSNSSYSFRGGNQVGVGSALASSPLASPYDADGNLKRATFVSQDPWRVYTRQSIRDMKDLWLDESKTFGSYNNLYGEVSIPGVEGLKYRLNLGLNIRQTAGGTFTGIGVTSAIDPEAPSSARIDHSMTTDWAVENLLTYDRTFGGKHNFNVVALYSAQENRFNRSRISALDLPADHFQYYNLGFAQGEITINPDDQIYRKSGLISWMGRVMYDYDNRYMLSATLRSDASSVLAPGHQWHTYPAISAGWNIASESFMSDVTWLNQLKLRVGYGETSNQAVGPYGTLGRLSVRPYNFGDLGDESYQTGYYISELPNPSLGWEYTETWNFGLDFGLWGNRLTGTIEYYRQHTKDILLRVDLPNTTGVPSYLSNIGETENKGLELSLNGVIIESDEPDGFTWEAGINVYANRNKLLALTSGQERNEGNSWFVGYPINVIYDYEKIGLWQEGDPYLDILEPGGNVGMIKVKYAGEFDADGTPVRAIGAADRQILKYDPNFEGGFSTRFSYKRFDLGLVGTFKNGGLAISRLYGGSEYLNLLTGRRNNINVDYWTPENRDAKYPRPGGLSAADNQKYANTMSYFDGTYLKVRTITLGYNFERGNWMDKVGITALRLYATASNPFVMFSPYHRESGMDPETNSGGRLPVISTNAPSTRSYLFGLNLTF